MDKLKNTGLRALKWLERYTKTDMVYLAKGGFWLGIGQFVATSSAFLMSVAFANLLAPDLYGMYKFVLSINSLLLITTLSGMDPAVTQSISRGYEGTLIQGVKEKMKWGTIGSIISLGIAGYYYSKGNIPFTIAFCLVAIFIPFTESTDLYNSLLWGKKLFSVQVKYNVINLIITLVVTTGTLFMTRNLYWILFAYLISMTIPNIFFIWRINKKYRVNNDLDPEAIKYGKHLSAINIMSSLLSQIDKVLVFHFVGAANLAVYTLAVAPTDQVKGLMKNINSLAMPQFSQRSGKEIKHTIWHKVGILFLFTSVMVIFYIILAPYFFHIFFPKYLSSIRYSQILSISLIPVIISGFIYTILESQKLQKEIYQYNFYGNLFGIIILIPLVYYFGIWGAITSRIITRFFSMGFISNLINKIS